MTGSKLIATTDVGEFFRGEVVEACSELGVKVSDMTEYYLVNLLCDFTHRATSPTPGEEPLALLYKRASEATLEERVTLLKQLGDLSLYISGFFEEFIDCSLVDVNYYISMGGHAYGDLSNLTMGLRRGQMFAEVYAQLAMQFTELVDVLNQVSGKARDGAASSGDLLRMYDRWVRTGSARVRKRLLEHGLLPTGGLPTEYIQ